MSEPILGEIRSFAFGRVPPGFAPCDGRRMPISPYAALFSLIGTTYGGDGKIDFKLPDLRGRVMVGTGQMPGGATYALGEAGGREEVSLEAAQIPQHRHDFQGVDSAADAGPPAGNMLARASVAAQPAKLYATPEQAQIVRLAADSIGTVGGGRPHANVQPYVACGYFICINGIFPQRT